jgi:hypothetical protein
MILAGSSPLFGAPRRRAEERRNAVWRIDGATRDRIRELNNTFRVSLDRAKGLPILTAGVAFQHDIYRHIAGEELIAVAGAGKREAAAIAGELHDPA